MEPSSVAAAREKLHRSLREIQAAMRLQRWSAEEPPVGAVLRFRRGKTWYVAMRRDFVESSTAPHWLMTTPDGPGYELLSWDMLKMFIGAERIYVASDWKRLITEI